VAQRLREVAHDPLRAHCAGEEPSKEASERDQQNFEDGGDCRLNRTEPKVSGDRIATDRAARAGQTSRFHGLNRGSCVRLAEVRGVTVAFEPLSNAQVGSG